MKEPKVFKSPDNGRLALKLANWLVSHNYACVLLETDDGVITITYTEDHGEGQIWPSIRINAGSMIWPKQSPLDLMLAFLEGKDL
jgi:hypothetical protein